MCWDTSWKLWIGIGRKVWFKWIAAARCSGSRRQPNGLGLTFPPTEDIEDVVIKIDNRENCSPWTKHSYKVIIKKFYKWLKFGDGYRTAVDYPPIVSWLRCNLKKKGQPRIKASDIRQK